MSERWQVHLVYTDARSNKFWRARVQDSTLYINYGRVGSDGQTSVKELGSASAADAALTREAAGKRKKGDVDQAVEAAPAPAPVAAPTEPQTVHLSLEQGGRSMALELTYDGRTVRTQVSETYDSAGAAAAAFVRIHQALLSEGYKKATS
jgi:predicted DNA-binding WGR domain protein